MILILPGGICIKKFVFSRHSRVSLVRSVRESVFMKQGNDNNSSPNHTGRKIFGEDGKQQQQIPYKNLTG